MQLQGDDIRNLAPVPKTQSRIPRAASVGGILLCLLFAALFLLFPRIMALPAADGALVPIFDASFLHGVWPAILLFALLGIFRECVRYLDRHYTRRVLWISIVVNALSLLLAAWIFLPTAAMNPQLDMFFSTGGTQLASELFLHFNVFLFAIVAFALALDSATAIHRQQL